TLSGRLQSMAASQDLLFDSNWAGVDIMALARSQLQHANDPAAPQIEIEGPSLLLSPTSAQALGMALHELSTNALKFGALSSRQGNVRLRWSILDETGRFVLIWTESGGPVVSAPAQLGFGHIVLVRMTEASLHARAAISYQPSGLEWSVEAPLGMVLAQ
ncbi:MAG: sensor histidine kinase, partial [Phreatobacter sp.]